MASNHSNGAVKRKLRSAGPVHNSPSEVAEELRLDEEEASEDESSGGDLSSESGDLSEDGDSDEEDTDAPELTDTEAEIAKAVREFVGDDSGLDEELEDDEVSAEGESDEVEDDEEDEVDDADGRVERKEDVEEADTNVVLVESELASDGESTDDSEFNEGNLTGDEARVTGSKDVNEPDAVEESDSEDEGELASRNTIGDVPLQWYKDEKHIGYDIAGKRITKKEKKDELEAFLARADDSKGWRKVYDDYNDEEVELTKDEIDMIRRLREKRTPHKEVNPFEPYVDWFEYEGKGHPLSNAPEPKRRFIPSTWEAKKVVKLVRAIRNGWISLEKPKDKPEFYLLWGDDDQSAGKSGSGLAYIPAPKRKLPGHEESYNPSEEYIPSQEEINGYQLLYEEDRPKFIPQKFDSLRQVPSYSEYIKDLFERCLDLYLCPRSRKKRVHIDPESLLPKLPSPKDLRPFPTTCFLDYRGHTKAVNSISTSPCGEWLASGSQDGSVRLWEVQTSRCRKTWTMDGPVRQVAWNPNPEMSILAIAVQNDVVLLDTDVGPEESEANLKVLLTLTPKAPANDTDGSVLCTWSPFEGSSGFRLKHQHAVNSVSWHSKGDYFATVSPDSNTRAVLVHRISKQQTQNPFRKHHGRVVRVLFHPSRPFMFVATKMHVRVYNLTKQELSKKLRTGLDSISSMAVHSGGDNLLIGSGDAKMCWFDMDLSAKPYRVIKNHKQDIRSVAYHRTYPLFATCSDDGTAHVFHGMVYSDLLQNPLIVPLKVLRGHQSAIFECAFHPKQPWLFTAGADGVIKLFCN